MLVRQSGLLVQDLYLQFCYNNYIKILSHGKTVKQFHSTFNTYKF